ncbi:hypothetical protein [Paenibacillus sp. HJGM_3]|uniref:hypothetical protein n=1 Tax=Paenibacillus sp. HJGM_3 TaxID=3379816 RepID=UPI00385B762D
MDRDNIHNHELDYRDKSNNKIASFLIFLAWAVVVIGLILPFFPRADDTRVPFFSTVSVFVLIGAFLRGTAEIIKLLHSINKKLK